MKENYYHLYISLKDRIRFEFELSKQNISFFTDENHISSRYYLFERDKVLIDKILVENEIIVNDETSRIVDYRDNLKVQKFYILLILLIVLIIFLLDWIL